MAKINAGDEGRTVTVHVPILIRRRGGRKIVLAPDGTNVATPLVCRHIDSAMVKAIARALTSFFKGVLARVVRRTRAELGFS